MENKDIKVLPSAMKSVDWQAVFAGLVFVIAANWLLFLLGTAIGVSIADATDMAALGDGLGFGTFLWIVICGIATYYAAGYMSTRLARNVDEQQGMLQALTMWSSAVVLTIVLAAMGASGILSAGQSVLSSAGSAGSKLMSGSASAVESLGKSGDLKGVEQRVKAEVSQYAAKASQEVSQEEVRTAMDQLDSATLRTLGEQLLAGKTEAAKETLSENTALGEKEIESVVQNVSKASRKQIREFKSAVDTASSYATGLAWALFLAAAGSLAAAIFGGKHGVASIRSRFPDHVAASSTNRH